MIRFVKRLYKSDPVLVTVVMLLMLFSLLLIYSSTGRLAQVERGGNMWYYFLRHLALSVLALVAMGGMKFFSWRWLYQRVGWLLLAAAGLVMIAAFGGQNINGAGRWITVPGLGVTFQPSELAKIVIVLYVAKLLSDYQVEHECLPEVLRYFWPPIVLIGLIFLDNFSTSALVAVVCLVLCWVGRVKLRLLAKWFGVAAGALAFLILLGIAFPKIKDAGRIGTIIGRFTAFFTPSDRSDNSKNYNYQSDQAHIAVALGQVTGCGPGNSVQRNFLPHPYSDFVYAIIIEEYGLVGGVIVLLLYSIILVRVGAIAQKTLKAGYLNSRGGPDIFPALVVIGLGFSLVLQAIFHMGVNVGVFPVTGQTLPLVSMGGTSLVFVGAALGIILNIAYSFSPEGLAEEAEKQKNAAGLFVKKRMVASKRERTERVFTEPVPMPEEDFDLPGDDLRGFEEEFEQEGRRALEELGRRGRRGM